MTEQLGLLGLIERAYSGSEGNIPELELDPSRFGFPGRKRFVRITVLPLRDEGGAIHHIVISHEDISERKLAEDQLRHLSLHDALTGLANRTLCLDRIHRAGQRSKRRGGYAYAVLYVNLDRFNVVNDSLGHSVGDQVLREAAQRLQSCVGELDTVARVGSDEFAVLLEEVESPRAVIRMAKGIREAMSRPFLHAQGQVELSASIGVEMRPVAGADACDLLRNANIAMRRARVRGRNRLKVFTSGQLDHAVEMLILENDMDRGVERNEFFLLYQPIVSMPDRALYGFEVLCRWKHPERGLIMPGEFIPVAEETGKIVRLGSWILREACRFMVDLGRELPGAERCALSVNVSARQLPDPGFVSLVEKALEESRFPVRQLKLEITETTLMQTQASILHKLRQLRSLGVGFSVDDFGTGYSSMSYLTRLPLDRLKVDLSFVRMMEASQEDREIVKTIIRLAHGLGLKVVAEGVETPSQEALLARLGCEYCQGYLYAKPLTAEGVRKFLGKHGPPPA